MCSICGIVNYKNTVNTDTLNKMNEVLFHRGPDQQGIFKNENVGFAHNRLAIIDVENGLQPMVREYNGKTYVIIYNGELYNTPELRKIIEDNGIVLQTKCDTEVLLYTYILFKQKCAEMLNGIYSFAILDEDKVYLARDRFGIKPFFYTKIGENLLFASELKALFENELVKPVMDKQGLWQLLFMSPAKIEGTTIFKNIKEIPPAYHGYFDGEKLNIKPYWQLKAKEFKENREDCIARTKYILTDAIKRQLVSDVPLSCFLSGGLDSSVISSVASREYKKNGMVLSTYSFEYEGNKENFKGTLFQPQPDDEYAVYLADYLGTNHNILTANTEVIIDLLEAACGARDMPGMADIDSSLLYYCSLVKKNHTVAISGECADEIFGGYPWFYRPEMLAQEFYPWIHDPFKRVSLFKDELVDKKDGYEYLKSEYQKDMLRCPYLDTDSYSMAQSRKATYLSTKYFMTSLLERKDRMSMHSGVEVRVPFSDHRILEYVYNVPWEIKFEGNVEKALLRNAMAEYLPDKILNRKKSPYPKTHDPIYEYKVTDILIKKLNKKGRLYELINRDELNNLLQSDNQTWFGQLMSKPQLISWLIQLDFWLEKYDIQIEI